MNYLLHRQKFRDSVMTAPAGLAELMADISREVLRERPDQNCLYEFIANYLESLLKTREKCLAAQYIIDEVLKNTSEEIDKLRQCGLDSHKSDSAVSIIKQSMENFIKRRRDRISDSLEDLNTYRLHDLFNELIQKVHLTEREILKSRPIIQCAYKKFVQSYLAAIKGHITVDMLEKSNISATIQHRIGKGPSMDELNKNATKVQAVYKGYKTRQEMERVKSDSAKAKGQERFTITIQKSSIGPATADEREAMENAAKVIQGAFKRFLSKHPELTHNLSIDEMDKITRQRENAAIVIQARYKGYRVRKRSHQLDTQKEIETAEEQPLSLPQEELPAEPTVAVDSSPEPIASESVTETTPAAEPEVVSETTEPAPETIPETAPVTTETELETIPEIVPETVETAETAETAETSPESADANPETTPELAPEPAPETAAEEEVPPPAEPELVSSPGAETETVQEIEQDNTTEISGETEQPTVQPEEEPKEPDPVTEEVPA